MLCWVVTEIRQSPLSSFVWMEPNVSPHLVLQLFEHESHRLAVEVSRRGSHRSVHICMGINPDEAQVRTLLGMATHWSESQAVKGRGASDICRSGYRTVTHTVKRDAAAYLHWLISDMQHADKPPSFRFWDHYLWSPPSMTRVCPAPTALLTTPDSILFAPPTVRGYFTFM